MSLSRQALECKTVSLSAQPFGMSECFLGSGTRTLVRTVLTKPMQTFPGDRESTHSEVRIVKGGIWQDYTSLRGLALALLSPGARHPFSQVTGDGLGLLKVRSGPCISMGETCILSNVLTLAVQATVCSPRVQRTCKPQRAGKAGETAQVTLIYLDLDEPVSSE